MSVLSNFVEAFSAAHPEEYEQSTHLHNLLNRIFQGQMEDHVARAIMAVLLDEDHDVHSAMCALYLVGLEAYRQFMLDSGFDVVKLEQRWLEEHGGG